jgi:drug/metabolite transporter (DMT)-like permease
VLLLLSAHLMLAGRLLPDFPARNAWLLAASGVVGLAVGDQLLFASFVVVGARVSMVVMTLAPVIGLLLAAVLLGERVTPAELAGIALTLGGIATVVLGRRETGAGSSRRAFLIGLLLALGAAACQAGGMVLAKLGMPADAGPLEAQLSRMWPALVGVCAIMAVGRILGVPTGTAATAPEHRRRRRAAVGVVLGTLAGPTFGVMLALFAIKRLDVGIATTCMALTPVLILPFAWIVERERLTGAAVGGALLAVVGTVVMALSADGMPTTPSAQAPAADVRSAH